MLEFCRQALAAAEDAEIRCKTFKCTELVGGVKNKERKSSKGLSRRGGGNTGSGGATGNGVGSGSASSNPQSKETHRGDKSRSLQKAGSGSKGGTGASSASSKGRLNERWVSWYSSFRGARIVLLDVLERICKFDEMG